MKGAMKLAQLDRVLLPRRPSLLLQINGVIPAAGRVHHVAALAHEHPETTDHPAAGAGGDANFGEVFS